MPQLLIPIIVTGLGSIGLTVSTATAGWIAGAIITGASLAATAFLTQTPSTPKAGDGSVTTQQPLPLLLYGYGRYRIGGFYTFLMERDSVLHQVLCVHNGKIIGFVTHYFGDDALEVDEDGWVLGPVLEELQDGRYSENNARIDVRIGETPETEYDGLNDAFGTDLPDNFFASNTASMYLQLITPGQKAYPKIFPQGRVEHTAIIDSTKLWDPRDETQDPDDPDTWQVSGYDNPMLALLHYLHFSQHGPQTPLGTGYYPREEQWITAINICDELVNVFGGGTIRRYRMGGFFRADTTSEDVIKTILSSCDGWYQQQGDGSYSVYAGAFYTPTAILRDIANDGMKGDIVAVNIQKGVNSEETVNDVKVSFTSPDHDYGEAEADPWQDLVSISKKGLRSSDGNFKWVQDFRQARRLAKILVNKENAEYRGTITTNLGGMRAFGHRYIRVRSVTNPSLLDRDFEVMAVSLDLENMLINFEVREVKSSFYNWSTSEEGKVPPNLTLQALRTLPVPADLTVVAERVKVSGEEKGVYLDVSFDAITGRKDLTFIVRYKADDEGEKKWVYQNVTDWVLNAGRVEFRTDFVRTEVTLQVQVASVSPSEVRSAWSPTATVSTASDDVAPSSPTRLNSNLVGGDDIELTWKHPNSDNVKASRVYRSTINNFSTATNIGGKQSGGPSQLMDYTDQNQAPGTWYYWVTAQNASGVESSPTGPVSETVV